MQVLPIINQKDNDYEKQTEGCSDCVIGLLNRVSCLQMFGIVILILLTAGLLFQSKPNLLNTGLHPIQATQTAISVLITRQSTVFRPTPSPHVDRSAPLTQTTVSPCADGCATSVPGCEIKGNISARTGERIYHLPGDPYYLRTTVDPNRGERWFCSESDAQANGWRNTR
jgi:hypothetical protein